MRWDGDKIISEGLDKVAAQEVLEKGLLTRLNRVLTPEGMCCSIPMTPSEWVNRRAWRG